jgi:O-6-methylguanine DNA methyltransferase
MKRSPKAGGQTRSAVFPAGTVALSWRGGCVSAVKFGRAGRAARPDPKLRQGLESVLKGRRIPRRLRVDASGLPEFTRKVLGACAAIPAGRVLTYGELAALVGRPRAARAVGQALGRNPFPILIPCHRVVAAGGRLNGFGGGLAWKEALLGFEGWQFEGNDRNRRVKRSGGASGRDD